MAALGGATAGRRVLLLLRRGGHVPLARSHGRSHRRRVREGLGRHRPDRGDPLPAGGGRPRPPTNRRDRRPRVRGVPSTIRPSADHPRHRPGDPEGETVALSAVGLRQVNARPAAPPSTTPTSEPSASAEPSPPIPRNELRTRIATVLQQPFLFSRSIRDNILLADPEADVAESSWRRAKPASTTPSFDSRRLRRWSVERRDALGRTASRSPRRSSGSEILVLDDALSAVDTGTGGRSSRRSVDAGRHTIVIAIASRPSGRRPDRGHGRRRDRGCGHACGTEAARPLPQALGIQSRWRRLHDQRIDDEGLRPRRVDWRLWRRILGHCDPIRVPPWWAGCSSPESMCCPQTARIIDWRVGRGRTRQGLFAWGRSTPSSALRTDGPTFIRGPAPSPPGRLRPSSRSFERLQALPSRSSTCDRPAGSSRG